ncbi:MAG: peptidoglycan DD-metalloendopeptidase family protein [Lachnospiraceae bacterium]|nr:peptidoglycan DD-metalloendopeptidase family protein [Lachnospiraceae bacterium]
MKGEKKTPVKGKGMYVLALCGVLAVSGAIYAGNKAKEQPEEKQDLVDLNETPEPTGRASENTPNPQQELVTERDELLQSEDGKQLAETAPEQQTGEVQNVASGEKEQTTEGKAPDKEETQEAIKPAEESTELVKQPEQSQDEPVKVAEQPEQSKEVLSPTAADLKFSKEEGLILPLAGNVLKAYNAEHAIYFETLAQFRTNPAVFLAGESGMEIAAAADGIVTAITQEDKTGLTVTMDLGNDYRIVYGQLGNAQVEIGDYVAAGEAFAVLAEPTKYYSLEGTHLYLQLWNGEQTEDPLSLAKE